MAFIGANDILVLEKASGRVQRVTNGTLQGPVLDLNVNSASERGLLGIALHPQFALNGWVYLFWTESSTQRRTPWTLTRSPCSAIVSIVTSGTDQL